MFPFWVIGLHSAFELNLPPFRSDLALEAMAMGIAFRR